MDIKHFKKFNNKLLKTIIIILFFLALLNYMVNPYNIFDNTKVMPKKISSLLKPEAKIQERYTKFIALKLDKRKIDTAFIGSSRPDWALAKNHYYERTGKYAENMAVGGIIPSEYIEIYRELVNIHPEVKNIYIAADFFMSIKKTSPVTSKKAEDHGVRYKIPKTKKITSSELGFALFSIQSSGNSIFTIFKNLAGIEKRMYKSDGTKHVYYNKEIDKHFKLNIDKYTGSYTNSVFDESTIEIYKNLYNEIKKDNRNVYIFIMPTHIIDQYLIFKNCQEAFEKWKIALTEITDIYDFQYPSQYTEEDVKPDIKYFFETSHSTHFLGDKIIDKLINDNNDFGHILTKGNVKQQVLEDKKQLIKYFKSTDKFNKWIMGKDI